MGIDEPKEKVQEFRKHKLLITVQGYFYIKHIQGIDEHGLV